MRKYRFDLVQGKASEPISVEDLPDDLAAQRRASHLGIEFFAKQPDRYRRETWMVRATDLAGIVVHEAPVMEGEFHRID